MKTKLLGAFIAVVATSLRAQLPVDGIHYAAGLNGIKGGSSPGPGIYLRDDNLFYYGTDELQPDFKTFVYVQAPQLMWVTDWKILGANVGIDVQIPLIYKQAGYKIFNSNPNMANQTGRSVNDHQTGIGDVKVEPLILGWHWEHFDTTLAYAFFAPSGHFTEGRQANLGDGEWTHMVSLGAVWYPDEKKLWAISILHHFEINSSQVGLVSIVNFPTPTTLVYQKIPCSTYTLEWGVSRTIFSNTCIGVSGYYQKQITEGSYYYNNFSDSEVAGLGPEISTAIPGWGLTASLRYAYEFTAYHRPEGHTVNLSLTKKF